jgi:hypothetical protein
MQAQIMRVEPGKKPKLYMNLEMTSLRVAISQLDAAAHLESEQRDDVESVMNADRVFGETKQYRRHLLGPGTKTLVTFYLAFLKKLPMNIEYFERKADGRC